MNKETEIINHEKIEKLLSLTEKLEKSKAAEIIEKGLKLKGLDLEEIAYLLNCSDPEILSDLYDASSKIKEEIYGDRIVLFAPLYISNLCSNDCLYCAFRAANKSLKRKALSSEEIAEETRALLEQGHKRILMVAGESYPKESGFNYILDSIKAVYDVKSGKDNIRRLNVNIAPLAEDEFRQLKEAGIGTYQLFQETYHIPTYNKVHRAGKKRDYAWRLNAIERAFNAGIDDVGIGPLLGLYDYRFEVLAMMMHIRYLEDKFGMGPHTISVPRMEPADGSSLASTPDYPVSDEDFKKIVAILRMAVPYTGIILSTRESEEMRRDVIRVGVSQISAGSRTNPGGYTEDGETGEQFCLGDHRSLDEVIHDLIKMKYIPSFCTACYRLGRTGLDFMDMAKPGLIKMHCGPNALSTFTEYLIDHASPETRKAGEALIEEKINSSNDPNWKSVAKMLVDDVKSGKRDCLV